MRNAPCDAIPGSEECSRPVTKRFVWHRQDGRTFVRLVCEHHASLMLAKNMDGRLEFRNITPLD